MGLVEWNVRGPNDEGFLKLICHTQTLKPEMLFPSAYTGIICKLWKKAVPVVTQLK